MASLQDLPGTAEKILTVFSQQLDSLGVELPERRYVAPGSMIVWDGEQMTVALMSIDQGHPGVAQTQATHPRARVLYATFSVNLVRSVSALGDTGPFADGGGVPDTDTMDADGKQGVGDAQALILAADAAAKGYLLTGPGEDLAIGPLQPLGPEGALMASRLLLSLSLA